MTETELKLAIAPDDVAALRRSAPLAGVRPRRRKLTTIYYDTADGDLARAGLALRLRKSGGRWTQTLKGGRSGTGGLHERGEWEAARPDATIDLSTLPQGALDGVADAAGVGERLRPAFTVDLQRETWEVEPVPGTRLEVALDRGSAHLGDRSDPVCEVEIELLGGDREAAFDLARSLVDTVALRPSAVTKAERGYRLFRGEALQPSKARAVELGPEMSVAQAARAVVGAALDQLQANEEGVLTLADPEFVHQARVGLRRMRSALRIFRDSAPMQAAQWREGLAEVARHLGEARDWDVLATESLTPMAKAFGDARLTRAVARRASARRRTAREAARAALASPDYARLVLDISRWLASDTPLTEDAAPTLDDFASGLLRKRHKRLVADARGLAALTPDQRHAVRIDAKRLRYALEGFASLYRGKHLRKYQASLSGLQDVLGAANDAVTATRLLAELSPPPAFHAFARGWLAARAEGDPAKADLLVAALEEAKPFRRRKT
jgi:triphosphatase